MIWVGLATENTANIHYMLETLISSFLHYILKRSCYHLSYACTHTHTHTHTHPFTQKHPGRYLNFALFPVLLRPGTRKK